jgi:hypothetical protein
VHSSFKKGKGVKKKGGGASAKKRIQIMRIPTQKETFRKVRGMHPTGLFPLSNEA